MSISDAQVLGRKIIDALGITERSVIGISINLRVGQPPTMSVMSYVETVEGDDLVEVLRDYELVSSPSGTVGSQGEGTGGPPTPGACRPEVES